MWWYFGGGAPIVAKNNSTLGMRHLLDFVINATHTNVIVMSAPHRYDLMRNSCVNNEVEVFNSKLHKRLQRLEKVEVIDVVSERNFYTKHVQHLNSEGKESMAKKIATTCLLNRKVESVSGKW
jgi:predicted GTPase